MEDRRSGAAGHVDAIWRYPVKSMQGEQVATSHVTERGLVGDRALALYDVETGKIASAKSPRMWPNLLEFHAAFVDPPTPGAPLPPISITMSDGEVVSTADPDAERILSEATGRTVRLVDSNPGGATYEQYVPPVDAADPDGDDFYREVPNDLFSTGSLHDGAPIHVLTTSTLARLTELYPEGRFDARRFRPNVVVASGEAGFVENDWVKRSVAVGEIDIRVTLPMLRCVMTTRPQGDLPKDLGILRTAAAHNRLQVLDWGTYPCVGVAGIVRRAGAISTGDSVELTG